MYEPSRLIYAFHVAGFQHYDGALVLDSLKPGKKLKMVREPDNPFDPNAIELRFKKAKLGYVPRSGNELLSTLMFYGHNKLLEARVQQVDPDAAPWKQVRVGIYIKDAR